MAALSQLTDGIVLSVKPSQRSESCSFLQYLFAREHLNKVVLFLALTALSTACSGDLTKERYIEWIHNSKNGLHVTTDVDDYIIEVQYQPAEYVALQRQGRGSGNHHSLVKEIANIQHYLLTIRLKNGGDLLQYNVSSDRQQQQKLYYLSYLFQNDITVQEEGQELPCVLYHFERSTSLKDGYNFVLGFENSFPESTEAKLVITSAHFGSLPIKIKISKNNIPSLSI